MCSWWFRTTTGVSISGIISSNSFASPVEATSSTISLLIVISVRCRVSDIDDLTIDRTSAALAATWSTTLLATMCLQNVGDRLTM